MLRSILSLINLSILGLLEDPGEEDRMEDELKKQGGFKFRENRPGLYRFSELCRRDILKRGY